MQTDWETHYQTGDTPWEKGEAHPGLVAYLKEIEFGGRILVPGCGTGHDVRALASRGAEVVGLDVAPSAVRRAQSLPSAGRESYLLGDLFALPDNLRGTFDGVFEHTCFCAINPSLRPDYVRSVHQALQPEGKLLAIFYLDPGHDSPDEGPPFEVSIAELDRLFSPYFTVLQEWLPAGTYPGREGREWMRLSQRK